MGEEHEQEDKAGKFASRRESTAVAEGQSLHKAITSGQSIALGHLRRDLTT
jgi:hypothetical protein